MPFVPPCKKFRMLYPNKISGVMCQEERAISFQQAQNSSNQVKRGVFIRQKFRFREPCLFRIIFTNTFLGVSNLDLTGEIEISHS